MKDPLAKAAQTEEAYKEQLAKLAGCKHPNVHFQNSGRKIRCIDCPRFWIAGWVSPNGMETDVADYTYQNPQIMDHEFRHSPDEAPRRKPISK